MRIIGYAAVDSDDVICGEVNGRMRQTSYFAKPLTKELDKQFLMKHLRGYSRVLYVCGENTYNDCQFMLSRDSCMALVTSPNEIKLYNHTTFVVDEAELHNSAIGRAMDQYDPDDHESTAKLAHILAWHNRLDAIVVLGGVSVYDAFSDIYTDFYLSTINGSIRKEVDGERKSIPMTLWHVRDRLRAKYPLEVSFGDYKVVHYS